MDGEKHFPKGKGIWQGEEINVSIAQIGMPGWKILKGTSIEKIICLTEKNHESNELRTPQIYILYEESWKKNVM